MKRLIMMTAFAALSGCVTSPKLDVCKSAELRRTAYSVTIRAADLYAMTGRTLSPEMTLARDGAVAALAILDRNCPVSEAQPK